jgi:eukaryotic-like serine/threonine-protein kinase
MVWPAVGRRPMQLLCPACHAPLAAAAAGQTAVSCSGCALEVDLSRLGTVAGRPRFVPERDRTGTVVADWQVQRFLGAGGMGQVYRAERSGPAGPQAAALKFLAAGLAGEADVRARFSREVKLLQGLEHPAIVRVTASGEEDGVPWFAMTLIDGPSLRARLNRGPLALDEVRAVFGQVLAALEHAHARGVVHRDLKPANVLLAAEGAVVADFGIARMADALAAGRTQLTDTAAVLGTVAYMSPEQRAGAALDHRSDLFSLGVMLYEALTGTLPQGAFAPPSALRPELGARLDAVVLRLLRPQPSDRFASAAQAGLALEGALAPARWPRRMALSAAAASVIAGAGGGWWALRGRGGTPVGKLEAASAVSPPPVPAPAIVNPPPLTPANRPPPAPVPQAASTPPEGMKSAAQAFEGKDIKGKSGDVPSKARMLRKSSPKAV